MKIAILTEAGYKRGYGHLTRCISISEAFEENGIQPCFILNSDKKSEPLLQEKPHYLFNWLADREKLFSLLSGADVAIIDSYLAETELYAEIAKKVKIPVYLDDNIRLAYPEGIIVNGCIYAEELSYNHKDCLLGTRYIPLRKPFRYIEEKIISGEIKSIMLTMGGSDDKNYTPEILKILNHTFPGFIKNVIIGSGFTNTEKIKAAADRNTLLFFNPDAEKMKKIMLSSDIAISASGQTLYELAATGTPTIAVKTADNQENNIKGWLKAGFIEYARDIPEIVSKMYFLSPQPERQKHSLTGRSYVDGKGAKRIAEYLLEALLYHS